MGLHVKYSQATKKAKKQAATGKSVITFHKEPFL